MGCASNPPARTQAIDEARSSRAYRGAETAVVPPPPVPSPACAADTFWDGIACSHARATCGGWDGESCQDAISPRPIAVETRARLEYAQIDAAARAVCSEDDETLQVYRDLPLGDMIRAVDAAVGKANDLDQRLARLREANATPGWRVSTLARAGSVYDCIRNGFLKAAPSSDVTPVQVSQLAKLHGIAGTSAANTQALLQATTGAVHEKWRSTRGQYLALLTRKTIERYVAAEVLAHRFALEGFGFTRAAARLPDLIAEMGEPSARALVESIADPTDPRAEAGLPAPRFLHYVTGVFDRDR